MKEKITDAAETEEEVLKLDLGPLDALRAKRKKHLPVALTMEEVKRTKVTSIAASKRPTAKLRATSGGDRSPDLPSVARRRPFRIKSAPGLATHALLAWFRHLRGCLIRPGKTLLGRDTHLGPCKSLRERRVHPGRGHSLAKQHGPQISKEVIHDKERDAPKGKNEGRPQAMPRHLLTDGSPSMQDARRCRGSKTERENPEHESLDDVVWQVALRAHGISLDCSTYGHCCQGGHCLRRELPSLWADRQNRPTRTVSGFRIGN